MIEKSACRMMFQKEHRRFLLIFCFEICFHFHSKTFDWVMLEHEWIDGAKHVNLLLYLRCSLEGIIDCSFLCAGGSGFCGKNVGLTLKRV